MRDQRNPTLARDAACKPKGPAKWQGLFYLFFMMTTADKTGKKATSKRTL